MRTIKCDTCGKEADMRTIPWKYDPGAWGIRYDQHGKEVDLCSACVGWWDKYEAKLRELELAKAAKE